MIRRFYVEVKVVEYLDNGLVAPSSTGREVKVFGEDPCGDDVEEPLKEAAQDALHEVLHQTCRIVPAGVYNGPTF